MIIKKSTLLILLNISMADINMEYWHDERFFSVNEFTGTLS